MNPTAVTFLLVLWLAVGGLVTVVLTALAGWRTGFHIRAQRNAETGMTEDSTLRWFVIIAVLFMGAPAFLLGSSVLSELFYVATATLAEFWWVPVLLFVLVVSLFAAWWHMGTRQMRRAVQGGEVRPNPVPDLPTAVVSPPVYTPTYDVMPYGQFGDGGLGRRG